MFSSSCFFTIVLTLLCAFNPSIQRSTPDDESYVAAVLEYQVNSNVDSNLQNYIQHIQEAAQQNVDIVVFPEMTLTSAGRAVKVPVHGILRENPIPALRQDLYDEILVNISAAARENEVYVVINIQEEMDCTSEDSNGEYCPTQQVYLFNTNVVFDRTGAVIDRYRKINLFGEFTRFPALNPDLGMFSTDFGVTFGHFICFDLMFQVPAVQVVQKNNLTDVIFTTMWFSEMPFLSATQIQESYAYVMDINFIASGANNVRVGSAGSGIYSGKAGALISTMPGVPTTRLLVSRVPKVPGKVNFSYPGPIYDNPADHDSLVLITDPSLPAYTSRPLVEGFQEFNLVDKEVSCRFRVRLNHRGGEPAYKYRAAAFSGVRSFSGVETGGSRVCAIFACTGDSIDTCGKRTDQFTPNTTAIFEELSIIAVVPSPVTDSTLGADDSAFFPVSLDISIMPLAAQDYDYEEERQQDITQLVLNLRKLDAELYTFAIWGRVFEWDRQDASPPGDDHAGDDDTGIDDVAGSATGTSVCKALVLLLLVFKFLLLNQ